MNELLLNILSVVVTAVILPLISFGGKKLIDYLNEKISNEKTNKLLNTATEIVVSAVRTVLQTYVDALKKEGNFNKDVQLTALTKAKNIAISQMNDELKKFIKENYGNVDNWLITQIETTIIIIK